MGRLYRSMGNTVQAEAEFDKARNLNNTADDRLLKVMSMDPHERSAPQPDVTPPAKQ